eukprot:gnl/MRDRNA2_/MRDRNA2_98699_c0_seq1.p1 gnl/MRDRNA2_/MRDRNA2_98699_c0~~gnl/MRDRNA2_/MRDRNA2_98699_c0_seq1.p1  ORF type:complete len:364 (-),score=40.88 gnl/MRDRNA2_/MRDRNA2_98699_c0_seq1:34-1125(-)
MASLDVSLCWDQARSFEDFEYHLRRARNGALKAEDWRLVSAWLFEKTNAEHGDQPRSTSRLSPPVCSPAEGLFSTPLRAKFNADSVEGQFINAISPGDTPQPTGWSPTSTRSPLSNGNQSPYISPEKHTKPISVQKPWTSDRKTCHSEDHPECTDLSTVSISGPTGTDALLHDASMLDCDEQFVRLEEAATKTFDMIMSNMSGFSLKREVSQITMPDLDSSAPRSAMGDVFDELHMTQEIPYSSSSRGHTITGTCGSSRDKLRLSGSSVSLRPDASKGSSIKSQRSSEFPELTRKRSTPAALRHASPPARITYMPSASVSQEHSTIRAAQSIGRCVYSHQYVITPPHVRHTLSLHTRMSPRGT